MRHLMMPDWQTRASLGRIMEEPRRQRNYCSCLLMLGVLALVGFALTLLSILL